MLQMLTAIAGVFVIFSAWVIVQHWVRKSDHLPTDCDVYGDTGKGCTHCGSRNACKIVEAQENDPSRN